MHTARNPSSYVDDVMNVRRNITAFTFRKAYFLSASEQLFFYLQIRGAFTPHQRSFPSGDGVCYRKSHMAKRQGRNDPECPTSTDTSKTQPLQPRHVEYHERWDLKIIRARGLEICFKIVSPSYYKEISPMWLTKKDLSREQCLTSQHG